VVFLFVRKCVTIGTAVKDALQFEQDSILYHCTINDSYVCLDSRRVGQQDPYISIKYCENYKWLNDN